MIQLLCTSSVSGNCSALAVKTKADGVFAFCPKIFVLTLSFAFIAAYFGHLSSGC